MDSGVLAVKGQGRFAFSCLVIYTALLESNDQTLEALGLHRVFVQIGFTNCILHFQVMLEALPGCAMYCNPTNMRQYLRQVHARKIRGDERLEQLQNSEEESSAKYDTKSRHGWKTINGYLVFLSLVQM